MTASWNEKNQESLDNPRPGDYWHEMFCPYLIVVDVNGDEITVLSCIDRDPKYNAKVSEDDYWHFDYTKHKKITRAKLEKIVKYESIDGFVADVIHSEKTESIAMEWRQYMLNALTAEYERLLGWNKLMPLPGSN